MGDNKGYKYERPEHEVCVDEFFIGRYEITQKQWSLIMGDNRARFVDDEMPAQRISWNDAVDFIRRLNKKENTTSYRLPTEAEWERAARAGTSTQYFWGDEISNDHAWYYGSSKFTAHRVGTAFPNAFGLYDMSGNVWEWVSDWYHSGYFSKSPKYNPKGPETGTMKTRKGGSMANLASYVRSASRYRSKPDKQHYIFGFRLARSVNSYD